MDVENIFHNSHLYTILVFLLSTFLRIFFPCRDEGTGDVPLTLGVPCSRAGCDPGLYPDLITSAVHREGVSAIGVKLSSQYNHQYGLDGGKEVGSWMMRGTKGK